MSRAPMVAVAAVLAGSALTAQPAVPIRATGPVIARLARARRNAYMTPRL